MKVVWFPGYNHSDSQRGTAVTFQPHKNNCALSWVMTFLVSLRLTIPEVSRNHYRSFLLNLLLRTTVLLVLHYYYPITFHAALCIPTQLVHGLSTLEFARRFATSSQSVFMSRTQITLTQVVQIRSATWINCCHIFHLLTMLSSWEISMLVCHVRTKTLAGDGAYTRIWMCMVVVKHFLISCDDIDSLQHLLRRRSADRQAVKY